MPLAALLVGALLAVSASSGSPTVVAACPMTHVHYKPYAGVTNGLDNLPWITSANGAFKGHLFYYPGSSWSKKQLLGARIFTTQADREVSPKVLWSTRVKGYALKLSVRGERLDAPGSFTASYNGWGDYPSYVEIPHAGCWRVTVSTGPVSGRFVFSALD